MKECKECNEFACGLCGSDNVSEYCGKKGTTQYETGAVRDTGGKGRMDLLPMCALIRISKHMEDALTHYPERNWEQGLPMHTMVDSAFRHLAKYVDGWTDEDHLCAAATNLLMAMWTEEKRPEMQDIITRQVMLSIKGKNTFPVKEEVYSLHSSSMDVQDATPIHSIQKKQKKTQPEMCECYDDSCGSRCMGTKERELCDCGGNKQKCDYFKEVRNE